MKNKMNDHSQKIYDGVRNQLLKQGGGILKNPTAQRNFDAFLRGFEASLIEGQDADE